MWRFPRFSGRAMALGVLCVLAAPVAAQEDAGALRDAIDMAGDGGWDDARALMEGMDPVAADLLEWIRLREGEGTYEEAVVFLARRPGWPGLDRVRATAERSLPEDLPAADVIAFFAGREMPETGAGVLALARAFRETGQRGEAEALLVQAWLTLSMSPVDQAAVAASFPDLLAPHHAGRADMLLWRWKRSEAGLLLPLLDEAQAALVTARIAHIRGDRDVSAELEAVPRALQDTPGLLYDRYSWLAAKGRRSDAITLLENVTANPAAMGEPFRWSGWRRTLARWLLDEGEPARAYDLAAQHWLTAEDGVAFADLEWLAGWIALRHLDRPDQALAHFETLAAGVRGPISESRAHYWIGRTHEALGDAAAAEQAFEAAANHQTAFYGLLAADRLGLELDPDLAGDAPSDDWQEADVMGLDTAQAGFLLLEAGERGKAVLFFRDLGRTLEPAQLEALGARLSAGGEDYYALLLGKSAAARGMILPRLLHPIHPLAGTDLPVEPALALAVARQESEFRADAGSPVGALGLMQLMPATAEEVAGELELPYSRGRLTADWEYNAALGSKYLANLEAEFGFSPVMIAAGYNAGPSRPKIWMDERGDPRIGEADIVDWIESIPFRETRNYVMRVSEAIPVYRARLSGEAGEIRFEALLVGEKPLIRPVARPEQDPPADPAQPAAQPAAPIAPGGPSAVRPIARPGE